jgi:phosphohistidine phosphatase
MKLYLLRHADAEPKQPGQNDSERKLTEKGISQVKEAVQKMKTEGLEFDLILTSPYLRAVQTAEIAADEFNLADKMFKEKSLASGCGVPQIEELINIHTDCESILLVGHEPDFGIIAGELLGLSEARPLKKAELVEIKI